MTSRDLLKNLRRGETLFPLFLLASVAIFFVDSMRAPPRPMLLPRMVQGFLLAMLSIQVVRSLAARPAPETRTEAERAAARGTDLKMLVTFAGMALIPVFAWLAGFLLTGCVYVLLTVLFWGGSRKRDIVIAEVILVALIWGVFQKLLQIDFPTGVLFTALLGR